MNVLTIDGFLEDPEAERERALAAKYEDIEHNKLNYRGISLTQDPDTFSYMEKLLECKFRKTTCFYRRYLEREENETYIHSDCLIGTFSAILFLNPDDQCQGGTAFWRHKKYGWDAHPTQEQLNEFGLANTDEFWQKIYHDGFHENRWEKTDYIPMKFNRLIIFWSHRFHSRYPKRAFGSDMQSARLIKTYFGEV